jgi:hypothetical protein
MCLVCVKDDMKQAISYYTVSCQILKEPFFGTPCTFSALFARFLQTGIRPRSDQHPTNIRLKPDIGSTGQYNMPHTCCGCSLVMFSQFKDLRLSKEAGKILQNL